MPLVKLLQNAGIALSLSNEIRHHLAKEPIELSNEVSHFCADGLFSGGADRIVPGPARQSFIIRYVERAVAAGVDARVDVWEGMSHGFLSGIGTLAASTQALDEIDRFLTDRLTASAK